MGTPHLEDVIGYSTKPPWETDQRNKAKVKFYSIVEHFSASENNNNKSPYRRSQLVRLTYEYSLSEVSKDTFLTAFFEAIRLSVDNEDTNFEQIEEVFFNFADYLLDNFFLPLKASGHKTAQPSPAIHSAVLRAQGAGETQGYIRTADRLSTLRQLCLDRDRYRCVISRKFDQREAIVRLKNGDDARDDDRALLREETSPFDVLEVAHILPHSLTQVGASLQMDPSREAALAVLDMLDDGIKHMIEGVDIDRPHNAITLTHSLHHLFGDFMIFFEPVPDSKHPNTYRIDTILPALMSRKLDIPITRTLYLTSNRIIDPPSLRLLAVHRAIAHILHLSAAGGYIDRLLEDAEEKGVEADGSTDLGCLVQLGLRGLSITKS